MAPTLLYRSGALVFFLNHKSVKTKDIGHTCEGFSANPVDEKQQALNVANICCLG